MARMKNKPALKGNGKGSGSARQGIDLNVISRVVNLQTAAAYEDGRIYIECVRERESGGKGGGGLKGCKVGKLKCHHNKKKNRKSPEERII